MKKKIGAFLKCVLFFVIVALVLLSVNSVLRLKYYIHAAKWPSTGTFRQFYEMDRNSVDVLFLGSSVGVNNFIPQQLYNEHGIRSYNLSSEQQNILVSYYWLREALRTQSPKLVVLEGLFLQDRHPEYAMNSAEGVMRKAIDPMKWSRVKIDAVNDICSRDPSQSALSYYLTNIRYHNRWKNLSIDDFSNDPNLTPRLYGWAPGTEDPKSVKGFKESEEDMGYQLRPDMVEYFERIVALCDEMGIELMLVNIPQLGDDVPASDYAYRQLAERCGVKYFNLRERNLLKRVGADFTRDKVSGHGNITGNHKNMALIGQLIMENYSIEPRTDAQYEASRGDYEHLYNSYALSGVTDFEQYLQMVNDPGFFVWISAQDDAASALTESAKARLADLGLKNDWNQDMFRHAYIAVIDDSGVSELTAPEGEKEAVTASGTFYKMRNTYSVVSVGRSDEENGYSSILINDKEYAKNTRGLNIVVYDVIRQTVVDSVCFDTFLDCSASR